MKIAFVLALLVVGLAAAGQFEVEDADPFDLSDADLDLDMEGMTLDEARQKWRLLRNMYGIIEKLESQKDGKQKRFFGSFFKKIKDGLKKAVKKVGHFFTDNYKKAKHAFETVAATLTLTTSKIDFDDVVNKLKPFIHSGMTVAACSTACTGAATAVLGPAAASAGVVCGPVCNGALSKLEDLAG